MNESFDLLCSMSPKLKGRQKTLKKAITVLALKKHFRRSSIFDKSSPVNNEDLSIIDANTEDWKTSGSNSVKSLPKKSIENHIIEIDSSDSSSYKDIPVTDSGKLFLKATSENTSDNSNVNRIQKWLDNIDLAKEGENNTFFSQVSTIYGDDAPKFDPESSRIAACSTFIEHQNKRFDELFVKSNDQKNDHCMHSSSEDSLKFEINKKLQTKLKESSKKHPENPNTSKNSIINTWKDPYSINNPVIDDTLLTNDDSLEKMSDGNFNRLKDTPELTPDNSFENKDKFVTTRKKTVNHNQLENQEEVETMLDSLYGEKWRKKQTHVLPMSEPRKKPGVNSKIPPPNTERKRQPSKAKNILKNVNPTPKKLNFDRLKKPTLSPWLDVLKDVCDSDSDSNSENNRIEHDVRSGGIESVKARLNFSGDSPGNSYTKNCKINSKHIAHDKENFEDSYWKESLEERIRKKMNNVKVPTKTVRSSNKKSSKNKNDTKELDTPGTNTKTPLNTNKKFGDFRSVKMTVENKKTAKQTENVDSPNDSSSISNSCGVSSDEEYDKEITRILEDTGKSVRKPLEDGRYTFLESLSPYIPLDKCDISARIFRTNFKHLRDELTKRLFTLYNEKVFQNTIPCDTEIEWNEKLRNTAGMCYCKKITRRTGNIERKVKISLSSKVLDSPDRLRDTLLHEMCHAGTWIVDMVSNGHGVYWKQWAFKAMRTFPELPPIKRCHSYAINTKYTYKCTGCGYSFGRHSKSLDIERKRCGHCYGKFEVLINKTTKSGGSKFVPATPKKAATGFALFVKDNYGKYKEPAKNHGDVMKILGRKFAELKVKTTT